jgi:hypothetical protein
VFFNKKADLFSVSRQSLKINPSSLFQGGVMNVILLLMILFSAFLFFSICVMLMHRVRVAADNEKELLVRSGIRLVVYSGGLLASFQMISQLLARPSDIQRKCDALKITETVNSFFIDNCFPRVWDSLVLELASSCLSAMSWLVPFVFAAAGVNFLSQGLLVNKLVGEPSEFGWCRIPVLVVWFEWLSKIIK